MPGCTTAVVTVTQQSGGSFRPPGLAAPMAVAPQASSPAPLARSSGAVSTTRVISYTYDPLCRLSGAEYSTGESFAYTYDAAGYRTAMTDATGVHTYTTTPRTA